MQILVHGHEEDGVVWLCECVDVCRYVAMCKGLRT